MMNYKKTLLITSGFLFAQSCVGMEEGRTIFYVGKDNKAREHDINAQELYHMRIPTDGPKLQPPQSKNKQTQPQSTQPVQIRIVNQQNPTASRPQTTQETVRINSNINQLQDVYQREAIVFENMHKQRVQLLAQLTRAVAQNNTSAADNLEKQIYEYLDGHIDVQRKKLNRLSAQINMHTRNQALLDQAKKQQEAARTSIKPAITQNLQQFNLAPTATAISRSEILPITIMTMASDDKPQEAVIFGPSLAHHEPNLELPLLRITRPREGDEYKVPSPEFQRDQQQNLEEALEKITTQDTAEFKEQAAEKKS